MKTCGKVIVTLSPAPPDYKFSAILCNRKKGHRGRCDLIMLDRTRKPARRRLLSKIKTGKR